jgi:SAM-dependent methyltransferase
MIQPDPKKATASANPPAAGSSGVDTTRAVEYWDRILDPQNLEREAPGTSRPGHPSLRDEVAFARTPDLAAAREWLAGGEPAWIMDLGAGLGANAFALAQAGHVVFCVDTSLARLKALRERADRLGLGGRIRAVVGSAEALPFAGGTVPALYTKSVLIHTRLKVSAAEITRVLAVGGRAALTEPMTGNPFVLLYRATLAPKAWQSITRYFTPEIQALYRRAPGLAAPQPPVIPFYFLSFLAFAFMFAIPSPAVFRVALGILNGLDAFLFRVARFLRPLAWFGLIRLQK